MQGLDICVNCAGVWFGDGDIIDGPLSSSSLECMTSTAALAIQFKI